MRMCRGEVLVQAVWERGAPATLLPGAGIREERAERGGSSARVPMWGVWASRAYETAVSAARGGSETRVREGAATVQGTGEGSETGAIQVRALSREGPQSANVPTAGEGGGGAAVARGSVS